ncbi:MAG: N-6 DNA methylase [Verrucomicrobiota bacterium]|jgi:type I restriction-modification system DNA methylase subunit
MDSVEKVLKAVLDFHAGDPQLLAVQLKASPASVQRWVTGAAKPRPAYEAKLRKIYSELVSQPSELKETPPAYRVTPHHPMITEAVDATLRSIREILHKRAHLSSRSQALDELSKLLFAHVEGLRRGNGGISRQAVARNGQSLAAALKEHVDETIRQSLPESLAHSVDARDFELKLKPQENELAAELVECFETLQRQTSSFSFSGFDILNEVFGKFLADSFIDEKELGQYLTPPEVVRFMIGLAIHGLSDSELEMLCDPKRCADFGLILDPSCGVASFLAETVHQLQERMKERIQDAKQREAWLNALLGRVVVGIDKSERMVRLALTNIAMFGFPMARLHLANSLARNGADAKLTDSLAGKVRLILTNPPFGASFQGNDLVKYKIATQWSRRFPGRLDSEILFMERYLDWLAPGGQLIAIVPDSILTNKAVFEELRRGIANDIDLCTVVSLPSVTFGVAGTNTKTSILHLRKKSKANGSSQCTAFAICQDIGFTVATKANQRMKIVQGEGDLPRILNEITEPPPKSNLVRWLEDAHVLERWDAQHHASLSAEVEQRLNLKTDEDLYVSDVAELVDERADPRRWGDKQFNYIEISDIDSQTCVVYSNSIETSVAPSRARKIVKAGDVLVSTVRPERGTVGIVGPHQDGSVCTTGLAVLRPTKINALTLACLLKTEFVIAQLMRNNVGIAYPAIDESCLLGVLLPARREDLPKLRRQAAEISENEERLHTIRKRFKESIESAGAAWRQMNFKPASKPHPAIQTTSRRQSRTVDSGSHDQETFQLAASHSA